jgi:hypothetical protein
LVVCVLGECDVSHVWPFTLHRFGQRRISRFAGGVFGALTGGMASLHPANSQRHVQLLAQVTAMRFKSIGRVLQAVVDVHRPHLPWPPLGTRQQQGR